VNAGLSQLAFSAITETISTFHQWTNGCTGTPPLGQAFRLTGSDCNRTFGLLLRPEPLSPMGLVGWLPIVGIAALAVARRVTLVERFISPLSEPNLGAFFDKRLLTYLDKISELQWVRADLWSNGFPPCCRHDNSHAPTSMMAVNCLPTTSGSSHLLGGVFLGVSQANRNQKTLEFSMFSCGLRFRPGEPVKSITYTVLM
jgi:hypothetical protein